MDASDYIEVYKEVRNSYLASYNSNIAMQFSQLGNKDLPRIYEKPNVFQENGGRIQYLGTTVNFTRYRDGYIYFHEVESNAIAISYEFSGCAMAKITMCNGKKYVFHIFLQGNDPTDCRRHWNSFVRNGIINGIIRDIILFKPFEPFKSKARSTREFAIGVIDANNQCFSIKIENNNNNFDYRDSYKFSNTSVLKPKIMYDAVIY